MCAHRLLIKGTKRMEYYIDVILYPTLCNRALKQLIESIENSFSAFEKVFLNFGHFSLDEKPRRGQTDNNIIFKFDAMQEIPAQSKVHYYDCRKWGHVPSECDEPERNNSSCSKCGSTKYTIRVSFAAWAVIYTRVLFRGTIGESQRRWTKTRRRVPEKSLLKVPDRYSSVWFSVTHLIA